MNKYAERKSRDPCAHWTWRVCFLLLFAKLARPSAFICKVGLAISTAFICKVGPAQCASLDWQWLPEALLPTCWLFCVTISTVTRVVLQYTGHESSNRRCRRPCTATWPDIISRAAKKSQYCRLAAGSGLANLKPGLETREPERRTCSGMGSKVSSLLQCDYIIITPWLQNINVIT